MSREFVDRGDFHLLAKMPFRECIERESVVPNVCGCLEWVQRDGRGGEKRNAQERCSACVASVMVQA